MDIIVDPEFERLVPPLSEHELTQLECNLLDDGALSPLIVWSPQNILLDGHHRLRLCRKHDIPFTTTALEFDSRDAARLWIIGHQLGRRNLPPEQVAYFRGGQYERQRSDPAENLQKPQCLSSGHNVHSEAAAADKTAERLAKEHGVTERTIRRDAQFAQALDLLAEVLGAEFRGDVLAGTSGLSRKDVLALSEMSRAELLAVTDNRSAMKGLAKEWRNRVDEQEDAEPERTSLAEPCGTQTDERERLRAEATAYRDTLENIVEVCRTDETSAEGLRQLLEEVQALAEDALEASQ